MTILFGNKNDPDLTVILPRSVWKHIQSILACEGELYPEESEEHEAATSIITSIKNQTGEDPDWTLIT